MPVLPAQPAWLPPAIPVPPSAAQVGRPGPVNGRFELKPAGTGLNRRVPGATLAASQAPHPRDPSPTAYAQLSPDEVRDLVEQFEFGVSEAMQQAEPGHQTDEQTQTMERERQ